MWKRSRNGNAVGEKASKVLGGRSKGGEGEVAQDGRGNSCGELDSRAAVQQLKVSAPGQGGDRLAVLASWNLTDLIAYSCWRLVEKLGLDVLGEEI